MYASQDSRTDEMIDLFKAGLKHFRARKKEWEAENED
jgi:hypothetical protein